MAPGTREVTAWLQLAILVNETLRFSIIMILTLRDMSRHVWLQTNDLDAQGRDTSIITHNITDSHPKPGSKDIYKVNK